MPLIFLSYPSNTFNDGSLESLAEEMTTAGLLCEKLANTEFVRDTVWIYAREYRRSTQFAGGKAVATSKVTVEVNVMEGGLDRAGKECSIQRMTAAVQKHAAGAVSVYVLVREIHEADWSFDGKRISLDELRR